MATIWIALINGIKPLPSSIGLYVARTRTSVPTDSGTAIVKGRPSRSQSVGGTVDTKRSKKLSPKSTAGSLRWILLRSMQSGPPAVASISSMLFKGNMTAIMSNDEAGIGRSSLAANNVPTGVIHSYATEYKTAKPQQHDGLQNPTERN